MVSRTGSMVSRTGSLVRYHNPILLVVEKRGRRETMKVEREKKGKEIYVYNISMNLCNVR